ncbi:quaternary ammonium compound efflux SMR transporter SugE [Methylophaga sp. OBS1]|uniref:quaternary ammonium compound efflux SMR transporter SugE n=1 Tax=Methylophaga sp. OBS1 TaxID=2991933 RepID=UPI0022527912|nr:quaternary ammonium compound efflux SMR transporter SugE [Methylophaga sp. OBS1]MCX4191048.1 quaternary ammonium compound efflux SMR transporter SugE [Methylophaga sp. OBS1]MCX4192006.1 quaternary ammonium compound efflux SMR transporter SugE [Methylophaga sp. OBS1]
MAWMILFIAGLLEVVWAIGLKYSDGLTRPLPTIATVFTLLLSFWLLGLAMRDLPIGTAYGVWVGIGAVGTVILGIMLFDESTSLSRLVSIAFIIVGIIGLKLSTAEA